MVAILKGATSQSIYVEVLDSASTTGGRKTGIAFNAAGLTAYYSRNQAAAVAITLATQTAAGAYSSGGWVEVDATNMPGVYRLDVPNAALASGVDSVVVTVKGASGMVQVSKEIQLTSINLQDAVRAGMTALPNAAAEAAGGLYTRGSGAGQINQANNGNIDANAVRLGGTTQTGRDVGASVLLSAGTGTGQLDFTSGVVKANLVQILATALTETAGQIAAAFRTFFNVATPVLTTASVNQTGDNFARLGAPAGASVSADVAAIKTDSGNLITRLTTTRAGYLDNLSAGAVAQASALATVQADTDDIQTRLPTALVGGRMDSSVGAMAAGVVTAAAVATNAIDADALAADAVTEIAAGVSVGSAPTAAQNATAVRTELAVELARVDVAISTRAAGGGGLPGAGSTPYAVTVTQPDGITPIEGVAVWVTTDAGGTNTVAGTLYTDTLGRINTTVGFMLDPGTYYLWRQHGDWNFTSPTSFTVT